MSNRSNKFIFRSVLVLSLVLVTMSLSIVSSAAQGSLIKQAYVIQTLGDQSGKYVAGKDAVVLVLLNAATPVDAATQSVTISRDGAEVVKLQPDPTQPVNIVLTFSCPSRAACGDWKAGAYTFDVKIGSESVKLDGINFVERKGLSFLLVPIKANYGPGDVRSTSGTWKSLADFTRQVYPVSPDHFKVKLAQEVDASGDQFNLKTDEGRVGMFEMAYMLQPSKACYEKPRPADAHCYDSISGFVKDRMGPQATLQGFAIPGTYTNINVESDDDAAATVAHEVAHLYNVGDEYQGGHFICTTNPPPAAYVGKDWNNRETPTFSCKESTSQPYPAGDGSLIGQATSLPYEVGGRGLLPSSVSFMGSGAPASANWVTPQIWSKLFDELDPAKKSALNIAPKVAVPRLATQTRWVYAAGLIGKDDKVKFAPWYSFMDSHEHHASTGDYMIRSVDAQGKVLASDELVVEFMDDPSADTPLTTTMFEESIPFPDGTAAFQVVKGDKVLGELKVSANAPTVKITAPKANETVKGSYTLKWEGSDKDNDKLYYTVYYSTDGEDWGVLAENTEKTSLTIDFSQVWGSDKPTAQIIVEVTDGVNAADVTSEQFSVPVNPPQVDIDNPKANATFATGAMLSLRGSAYDPQDEEITSDDALVWASDVQGELGKGALLNVKNLKAGKHTITLTATNSFKTTGTATVTITIADKPASTSTGPSDFTSKAGGFTVKMPGTPAESSSGGVTQLFSMAGDAVYVVKFVQYPADVVAKMSDADIDKAIIAEQQKGMDAGDKVTDQQKVTLDGNSGIQVTVTGANSGKGRFIFVKAQGRLYTIAAAQAKSASVPADVDTFLDSFKLTK